MPAVGNDDDGRASPRAPMYRVRYVARRRKAGPR